MSNPTTAIAAQATLHHAYFLGLQLMVASNESREVSGAWIYRLFRQQHEQFFLQSFEKLGLTGLPDAVACARYHVLSNTVGGVPVEYAEESDRKAWVRFRYPRWMFHGPAICGVPLEASRGFLRGWYAHNGVSLNNPQLGFVCVSEDMTGEFGFCGYFKEFDHALKETERLQFAQGEYPPPFDSATQPKLPSVGWDKARIAKANRNYAVAYVRNAISALVGVIGREAARRLGGHAARLIGLQYFSQLAESLACQDGNYLATGEFLSAMFAGMGDRTETIIDLPNQQVRIHHRDLRIVAGLSGEEKDDLLSCWLELWLGTIHSHRIFKQADVIRSDDGLIWTLSDREAHQAEHHSDEVLT